MHTTNRDRIRNATLVLALLAVRCSGGAAPPGAEDPQPAAPTETAPSARTLAIPGTEEPGRDGQRGGSLRWVLPQDWVEETPASRMRFAQYRIPGSAGDGECVVFYFGPGQGGDPMSNAQRWAGQFKGPDGAPAELLAADWLEETTVPVMLVEVRGTYDGGMSGTAEPARPKPDHILLGGIAEGPDAPWFFKFTGPASTVEDHREAFLGLLRSIRRDG